MSEHNPEGDRPQTNLTPRQLAERLAAEPELRLIDIREAFEWSLCRIDGAEWLPMNDISGHLDELGKDESIVFYCHHGSRSEMVLNYLLQLGYTDIAHLHGGIDAWAREIDPTMPTY